MLVGLGIDIKHQKERVWDDIRVDEGVLKFGPRMSQGSGKSRCNDEQMLPEDNYVPAFFSWMVIWCQSTFMRSRRDIHRSACS